MIEMPFLGSTSYQNDYINYGKAKACNLGSIIGGTVIEGLNFNHRSHYDEYFNKHKRRQKIKYFKPPYTDNRSKLPFYYTKSKM